MVRPSIVMASIVASFGLGVYAASWGAKLQARSIPDDNPDLWRVRQGLPMVSVWLAPPLARGCGTDFVKSTCLPAGIAQ